MGNLPHDLDLGMSDCWLALSPPLRNARGRNHESPHNHPRCRAVTAASVRFAAPVLPMAEDTWLRTVPTDRKSSEAMAVIDAPPSTSRSHPPPPPL